MNRERKRSPRGRRAAPDGLGVFGARSLPIWIVAAVVVLLRILAASSLQEQLLMEAPVLEDGNYLSAIQNLHSADPGEPVLPRGSVLYPRIVGALPGVPAGDLGALAVFQSIVEGLSVLILGLWIAPKWGVLAATIGGLLYALDPMGAFFAARLVPTSLAVLLFAISLLLLDSTNGSGRRGPAGALVFGAIAALGFLLSPLLFVTLALYAAYRRGWDPATHGGDRPRLPLRIAGAVFAVAPLALAAVLVSAKHAEFRDGGPALSWGSAVSVYHATRAESGGTLRTLQVPQWQTESGYRSNTWEAIAREGSSYDVFRFHLARGLQTLIERPVEYIGVELVKLAGTLGSAPLPDAGPTPTFVLSRSGGLFAAGGWTFALLLGLGLAGGFAAPAGPARRLLLLGMGATLAVCLLGTTSASARQPAVLLLAFGAGGFLASALGRLEGGRARSLVPILLVPAIAAASLALGKLSPTAALLDPSEDYRLAGLTAMARSPREAVPLLERAAQVNPSNVEARVSLARAYQRDGLIEAAADEFRRAFAIDSTSTSVLLGVASLEQEAGNTGRALELASRLVQGHPNNPLYLNEAARMFLQAGRWEVAKPLLVRALEIKPDYRTAQTNLEAATRIEMDMERSLVPDEMRLPADDPFNQTLGEIGRALQGNDLAAADSLIRIGETELTDHVLPHWMRAAYHARAGDFVASIRSLEHCNRLAPCRPAIVAQLGQLYMQAGREGDARKLFDGCAESSPELSRNLEQVRQSLFGP